MKDRVALDGSGYISFDKVTEGENLKQLLYEWTILFGLKMNACPSKDKQVIFSTGTNGYSLEVVPYLTNKCRLKFLRNGSVMPDDILDT